MTWVNNIITEFYEFLKDKTIISQPKDGWVEISTPFVGLFNDTIDLYVKKEGDKIIISDDGETLRNLRLAGVDILRSSKRKELLDAILLNYGLELKNDELITIATAENFVQKKLNFISSIIELNDFYLLAKQTVTSVFFEDVRNYLDSLNIVYTPHFISKGKTGLEFVFDFQIAYRKKEIVIKTFNTLDKRNIPIFLFSWSDIKQVREALTKKTVSAVAFLNDTDKKIDSAYLEALTNYNADYILWSERNKEENIRKLKDVA